MYDYVLDLINNVDYQYNKFIKKNLLRYLFKIKN